MKKLVIINSRAGTASDPAKMDEFMSALRQLDGVEAHILQPGDDATAIASDAAASGVEVVGAAGGDGTISSIAAGLAGTDTALLAIPMGTLNHFSVNMRMPSEGSDCLKLLNLTECTEKRIDLGRVNGRYFINNSSVGLYPRLVRMREKRQEKIGKWPAYAIAVFEALKDPRTFNLSLKSDEVAKVLRAGLVFISNNHVTTPLPGVGDRARMDDGFLDLYVVKAAHTWALAKVSASFLSGKLDKSPLAEHILTIAAEINTGHTGSIHVAADGEVYMMQSPLKYESVPKALKVRIPLET